MVNMAVVMGWNCIAIFYSVFLAFHHSAEENFCKKRKIKQAKNQEDLFNFMIFVRYKLHFYFYMETIQLSK